MSEAGGCGSSLTVSNFFPSPLLKCHVVLYTFPQKLSLLSICFFIQFFLSGSKLSSWGKKKKWEIITAVADVYNSDN